MREIGQAADEQGEQDNINYSKSMIWAPWVLPAILVVMALFLAMIEGSSPDPDYIYSEADYGSGIGVMVVLYFLAVPALLINLIVISVFAYRVYRVALNRCTAAEPAMRQGKAIGMMLLYFVVQIGLILFMLILVTVLLQMA